MKEKPEIGQAPLADDVGFAAVYKGKAIATAPSFNRLIDKGEVKRLIGNKDLIIQHTVPEGMIVVY